MESVVVVGFGDEAAALRGTGRLRNLDGVEVGAAVLAVIGEGRCRPIPESEADDSSVAFARQLDGVAEAAATMSEPSPRAFLAETDSHALAGVLAILPLGHAVVVAQIRERDPSALAAGIAWVGGRLLQRRPTSRAWEASATATAPADSAATEIEPTVKGN